MKKYDGVKLFKVSHKGYHDMRNVAQPLTKESFDVAIKAMKKKKIVYPKFVTGWRHWNKGMTKIFERECAK